MLIYLWINMLFNWRVWSIIFDFVTFLFYQTAQEKFLFPTALCYCLALITNCLIRVIRCCKELMGKPYCVMAMCSITGKMLLSGVWVSNERMHMSLQFVSADRIYIAFWIRNVEEIGIFRLNNVFDWSDGISDCFRLDLQVLVFCSLLMYAGFWLLIFWHNSVYNPLTAWTSHCITLFQPVQLYALLSEALVPLT